MGWGGERGGGVGGGGGGGHGMELSLTSSDGSLLRLAANGFFCVPFTPLFSLPWRRTVRLVMI